MANEEERSAPARDRAFLALLLLVGAGALASGLVQLLVLGNGAATAVFDAVLGMAVLLVSLLFVAPLVVPTFFGDPTAETTPVLRPYLPFDAPSGSPNDEFDLHAPPPATPPGRRRSPARASVARPNPKQDIPRWADPLVGHAPYEEPAVSRLTRAAAANGEDEPPEESDSEDNEELPGPAPGPSRPPSEPAQPTDMIHELDEIAAEIDRPRRRSRPGPDTSAMASARPA